MVRHMAVVFYKIRRICRQNARLPYSHVGLVLCGVRETGKMSTRPIPYESPHRNLIPDFSVLFDVTKVCEVNGYLEQGQW